MANVYNKPIVVVGNGGAELPVDNGEIYEGKYRVRYFDIDGTVLKIEYVAEGGTLNPPTNPNYDPNYLIFDNWNYNVSSYVITGPIDVGAIYNTIDNLTYMFLRITTQLTVNLYINGMTSIDWGDGTVSINTTHSYTSLGNYVIKISGNFNFTGSQYGSLLGGYNYLTKLYLSNSVTNIGAYEFQKNYALSIVSIPNSITNIDNYGFAACYSLSYISIPNSVVNIKAYTFQNCYSLSYISIPNSITNIGASAFVNAYSMKSLIIPKNIKNIGASAFNYLYSVKNYIILCTNVPVLEGAAFQNINQSTIIWTNDNIVEDLKADTNWSKYIANIIPLSWYPNLTNPNA